MIGKVGSLTDRLFGCYLNMASNSSEVVVDTSKDVRDSDLGSPQASSLVLDENKQIRRNFTNERDGSCTI